MEPSDVRRRIGVYLNKFVNHTLANRSNRRVEPPATLDSCCEIESRTPYPYPGTQQHLKSIQELC
jgi:hypothetical protein